MVGVRVRAKSAVAGLVFASLVAGCGGSAPKSTYDLTAPRDFRLAPGPARGLLVVNPPSAVQVLDTERIVVQPRPGEIAYADDGQWSDRLPKLLQARMIQAFENASRLRAVGRPGERLVPDWQLVTDIRQFAVVAGGSTSPVAVVEISAKLVGDRSGRIGAGKVFAATAPANTDAAGAAEALDNALSQVLRDMVRWATSLI